VVLCAWCTPRLLRMGMCCVCGVHCRCAVMPYELCGGNSRVTCRGARSTLTGVRYRSSHGVQRSGRSSGDHHRPHNGLFRVARARCDVVCAVSWVCCACGLCLILLSCTPPKWWTRLLRWCVLWWGRMLSMVYGGDGTVNMDGEDSSGTSSTAVVDAVQCGLHTITPHSTATALHHHCCTHHGLYGFSPMLHHTRLHALHRRHALHHHWLSPLCVCATDNKVWFLCVLRVVVGGVLPMPWCFAVSSLVCVVCCYMCGAGAFLVQYIVNSGVCAHRALIGAVGAVLL
jgi:hypothetical protein